MGLSGCYDQPGTGTAAAVGFRCGRWQQRIHSGLGRPHTFERKFSTGERSIAGKNAAGRSAKRRRIGDLPALVARIFREGSSPEAWASDEESCGEGRSFI